MTQPDLAALVRGLSESQRNMLLWLLPDPNRQRDTYGHQVSGSAIAALERKGLARKGWSAFNERPWSITERGLRVRQALLSDKARGE